MEQGGGFFVSSQYGGGRTRGAGLKNNDLMFQTIFDNLLKYFDKVQVRRAEKQLCRIWTILKGGICHDTLEGLLLRLAIMLHVNEDNVDKLSFVNSDSDKDGDNDDEIVTQIKHKLDESLFSQMVLKIGCFMDIYNDLKSNEFIKDDEAEDESNAGAGGAAQQTGNNPKQQRQQQQEQQEQDVSNVLFKFTKYYYHFENDDDENNSNSTKNSQAQEHFLLRMNCAANGDTLLAVAKENEDKEFEKILLKYMVSSEIINDILTKHSNYIYSEMRTLRTRMNKDDKKEILKCFHDVAYKHEFEGVVFMLVSMFAASIVTSMAAMKMKKK